MSNIPEKKEVWIVLWEDEQGIHSNVHTTEKKAEYENFINFEREFTKALGYYKITIRNEIVM